ncbi:MAG: agmatinase family protein [Bacteroidota bacterium]
MVDFNPDAIGISNGNLFGFPITEKSADIIVIPVPWDVTASYRKGSSQGPKAILEASIQLDFYHPKLENAHKTKVFMTPISDEWLQVNEKLSIESTEYIQHLESGSDDHSEFSNFLVEVDHAHKALTSNLKERCEKLLRENKILAVLGGEHSTPLGLIQALNNQHKNFGILQIDAHADLRNSYENFNQSHASIMFNVLKTCPNVSKLVQIGIRDISQGEIDFIQSSKNRIRTFFDWDLKNEQYNGQNWAIQVDKIISELPEKVYVSFDIDGLIPSLCPNTGTPVPGGFTLEEVNFLLFNIVEAGKKIIGFDLNEVSPGASTDIDANIGARALWNLICLTEKSRRMYEV